MRMQLPDHAYSTYGIVMPKSTHTRKARCEEVDCVAHQRGWVTSLDTSIAQQRDLAKLIIKNDGNRRWTTMQTGTMVQFVFPPGQQCFADHRVPLDRPPIFTLARGKEYRPVTPYVNGGAIHIPGTRTVRGEEWVERLGENQQAIIDARQQG